MSGLRSVVSPRLGATLKTAAHLSDTCTVVSVTRVPSDDEFNPGWTEDETETTYACRLDAVSGRERVIGGRVADESDAVVTLPYDAILTASDRITHDGATYEVVDIPEYSDQPVVTAFVRKS